jgi:hypothetical protein
MADALTRRDTLALIGAGGLALSLYPRQAAATTALAVSLDELVARSGKIFFGRPLTAHSRWVDLGAGRRIVTYTTVQVEEPLEGELEAQYVVRTLGGKVGKVGQLVHGEAHLRIGEDNLIFLRKNRDGAHVVTARAQGQYPLHKDERGTRRLRRSPRLAHLVGKDKSAAHVLVGRTIAEARQLVLDALGKSE